MKSGRHFFSILCVRFFVFHQFCLEKELSPSRLRHQKVCEIRLRVIVKSYLSMISLYHTHFVQGVADFFAFFLQNFFLQKHLVESDSCTLTP